jgi:hypothetical protein
MVQPGEPAHPTPFRDDQVLVLLQAPRGWQQPADFERRVAAMFQDITVLATPALRAAPIVFETDERAEDLREDELDGTVIVCALRLPNRDAEAVQRTVDAINARIEEQQQQQRPLQVAGATLVRAGELPLIGASQGGWSDGGGPGGRPIAGSRKYFRPRPDPSPPHDADGDSRYVRAEYERIIGRQTENPLKGAGVRVAVLDTWPVAGEAPASDPVAPIAQFIHDNAISGADHPLLVKVLAANPHDRLFQEFEDKDPTADARHVQVNWEREQFEREYDMSDHGLFVAGIIRDIAPHAHIKVYRVLNNNGGGDVWDMIAAIVQELALVRADRDKGRVIINMSFGFLVPPRLVPILEQARRENRELSPAEQIQALKNTSNPGSANLDLQALRLAGVVSLDTSPGRTHRVRQWRSGAGSIAAGISIMAVLFSAFTRYQEVLFIASAGNDSERRKGYIFPPRFPASFEDVMGVSAANAPGSFASFSNRDDIEADRDDGVVAFGGERIDNPADQMYDTHDGLMGLAIAPALPPPAGGAAVVEPEPGWAMWAGTSFAAPVVAGFAAAIWRESGPQPGDPPLSARQLISQLVSPPFGPRNEILLVQRR